MVGEDHQRSAWYTHTWHDGENYVRVIRATACNGTSASSTMACAGCSALWSTSKSLRQTVLRARKRRESGEDNKNRRWKTHTHAQMREALRIQRRVAWSHRRTVSRLRTMYLKATGQIKTRPLTEAALEHARRKDMRRLLADIKRMREEGTFAGKAGMAVEVASNILQNASEVRTARGRRYSAATRALLSILRNSHGQRVYNMVALNLNLAHERTARRWAGDKHCFGCCLTDADFEILAAVYTVQMQHHGLAPGSIPVGVAEDETKVTPKVGYDCQRKIVVGYCGQKCANGCLTAKTCRSRKCQSPHSCIESHSVPCGNGGTAYDELVRKHATSTVGTQGRLLVINPMHEKLARLPMLWTPTCLTFTCDSYILQQWEKYHALWDKWLKDVVGPLVCVASDGASTRRRAMQLYGLLASMPGDTVYTLTECPGFVFGGKYRNGEPILYLDQDYIHCGKKLIQCMVHAGRVLVFGHCTAQISMLGCVLTAFHHADHGMKQQDLERLGYNAMDWDSALRLLSPKVLRCLTTLIAGTHGHQPNPALQGVLQFLTVVRTYVGIFASTRATYLGRIGDAAFVCTALRLWRGWVLHVGAAADHVQITVDTAWITREAFQDALMSCHYVVLLIMTYRDRFPTLTPTFRRTGTDCCEDKFSSFGSFVENKRVYTFLDALQTIRSQVFAAEKAANHGIEARGKRRANARNDWEEQPPPPAIGAAGAGAAPEGPGDFPTDPEIRAAWHNGADRGREWAQECGMRPIVGRNRLYPPWWLNPHLYDGITPPTLQDDNGADHEDYKEDEDAVEDRSSGDDGGGDENPGAGERRVSEEQPANEPQEEKQREEKHGEEAEDDAQGEDIGNLLQEADALVAESEHFMEVPGIGRTHMNKIMKWLTDDVGKLSADRSVRVQQVRMSNDY